MNDTIDFVQEVITTEMNSATDNPVSVTDYKLNNKHIVFITTGFIDRFLAQNGFNHSLLPGNV